MELNRNTFFIKRPVQTNLGVINFLTVEDYLDLQLEISLISLNSLHIFYAEKNKRKMIPKAELEELRKLKTTPLLEIVASDKNLLTSYIRIFTKTIEFNENYTIDDIFTSNELFMDVRKVVMDMNLIKEEKVFMDERLQKGEENKKKIESVKDGDRQTIEDMASSVVALSSHSFDDVGKMTLYQLYTIYSRLVAIKEYDTSILFKANPYASSEIKVEHWTKHIDLLEGAESKDMRRAEFEDKFGKILK